MSLNPDLLYALDRLVGPVKIINAGQPLSGFYYDDIVEQRRKLKILRRGETYLLSCPFCNDQRGRLSVNHRYGLRDEETGDRGTNLWKCYNEECQHNAEYRTRLRSMLLPEMDVPRSGPKFRQVSIVKADPTKLEACEFNGVMIPITELPPDHKAVRYLQGRNFNIAELVLIWDIGYAESVPARTYGSMAQDRIIVPVHQQGVQVGWQARYIGEENWKTSGIPKYLTYFPKSLALYGMDQVKDEPIVVLVEGASDVWRYGPGAVCGFGKCLSYDQAKILAQLLNDRPLILIPDANDKQAFDSFCKGLDLVLASGYRGPYGIAPLPRGKDPANMSRTTLRSMVSIAAESAKKLHNLEA